MAGLSRAPRPALSYASALASAAGRSPRRWLVALSSLLLVWQARAEQRHRLAALDAAALRDMGIGRAAARREARKPFWTP